MEPVEPARLDRDLTGIEVVHGRAEARELPIRRRYQALPIAIVTRLNAPATPRSNGAVNAKTCRAAGTVFASSAPTSR